MCYLKKKTCNLLLKKSNLLCTKREKNNLSRGKIPAPANGKYQMVCPLVLEKFSKMPQNTFEQIGNAYALLVLTHNLTLFLLSFLKTKNKS